MKYVLLSISGESISDILTEQAQKLGGRVHTFVRTDNIEGPTYMVLFEIPVESPARDW